MQSKAKAIDELLKVYVESEIINYNYHKHMRDKYIRDKHKAYEDMDILPSTATGGSVIKMPEKNYNSQEARNKQLGLYIDELNEKISLEQEHIDTVDIWLKTCCRNYNQEKMMHLYMIRNLCKDAEKVAEALDYSADVVRKTKERLINRIICKYFQ